jgi:hypothetical protein
MRFTQDTGSLAGKDRRFHDAQGIASAKRRRGRHVRWAALLLPAAVLYFIMLIQVEIFLSSSSRRTEKLEHVRDSLRAEFVLESAALDERLSLDSLLPLTERRNLHPVLPDRAVLVPGRDGVSEHSLWASVLRAVAAGMGPSAARAGEAEKAARRTLAAVGLP